MGTKTQKLSNVVDQIVEWQSVFTGDGSTGLTAVAGRGYFIDTTSGTVTVTLPASPKQGDVVQLKDYARTWGTNAVSIASTTFDGVSNNPSFSTSGQTVTLVYMDGTKGWSLINEDTTTGLGAAFVAATGGTVTTDGNYKVHTFTGDGCFVVSSVGNPAGSISVDYLVVAGGGAGSSGAGGGGGGAGGFREGYNPGSYCASPLATSALPVSATTYPITVGSGGSASPNLGGPGGGGSNSVFSTITSAGGGGTGAFKQNGLPGGSGGGASSRADGCGPQIGGTGNTPPVSPPQGNSGGNAEAPDGTGLNDSGGGGGGAGGAGRVGNVTCDPQAGPGGVGATTYISGSSTTYAGGGGGGRCANAGSGLGGPGGGGKGGSPNNTSVAGTANTGGGGGGAREECTSNGGSNGGKGIVIIRYKFQN